MSPAKRKSHTMNALRHELAPYRVILNELDEETGEKIRLTFDCYAEDHMHAVEQARDARPGCKIIVIDEVACLLLPGQWEQVEDELYVLHLGEHAFIEARIADAEVRMQAKVRGLFGGIMYATFCVEERRMPANDPILLQHNINQLTAATNRHSNITVAQNPVEPVP